MADKDLRIARTGQLGALHMAEGLNLASYFLYLAEVTVKDGFQARVAEFDEKKRELIFKYRPNPVTGTLPQLEYQRLVSAGAAHCFLLGQAVELMLKIAALPNRAHGHTLLSLHKEVEQKKPHLISRLEGLWDQHNPIVVETTMSSGGEDQFEYKYKGFKGWLEQLDALCWNVQRYHWQKQEGNGRRQEATTALLAFLRQAVTAVGDEAGLMSTILDKAQAV